MYFARHFPALSLSIITHHFQYENNVSRQIPALYVVRMKGFFPSQLPPLHVASSGVVDKNRIIFCFVVDAQHLTVHEIFDSF